MLVQLFYLLRRACYFLLGRRRFKVRVNTHPWAWPAPVSVPVVVPGSGGEVAEAFGLMPAAGTARFVAALRRRFPQAVFTPASWRGEEPWSTRAFEVENAGGEEEQALLAQLEQTRQDLLLSARGAFLGPLA